MLTPPHAFDDVAGYLFKNYGHLLTAGEEADYRLIIEGRGCQTEAEVLARLGRSEIEFYAAVRDRLLREHRDEIQLNRCPECDTLCRTPTACLCPNRDCHHTWFEKRRDAGG